MAMSFISTTSAINSSSIKPRNTTLCSIPNELPKKVKVVISTAVAAATVFSLTVNAPLPALADLNKFEAEMRGEFGIGSAAQYGSADLKKAVHSNENFRRANFTSADMRESDFSGSTFNGAYLEKAVAYKANFSVHFRSLSASSNVAVADDDLRNQVLVEGKACARAAVLNRPSNLNALTKDMVARLKRLYVSWEDNSDIGFVIMKGNGRAFCAGGDAIALHNLIKEGRLEDCRDFFRNLYLFIYNLSTYLKPHVALLDGITMGGGAGVSVPGIFRVATERTIFSNPEVHIGFHPDAGASFYLSHLSGHIGEYLALTGERLKGVDMIATGLATHFAMSDRVSWIDERLAKLVTDDPAVIDSSLAQCGDIVYPDKSSILHRLEVIDRCFCHDTVEEIIDALEKEVSTSNENWCKSALKKLKEASPLSLKVTLRSIREGRFQTLDECLTREYRMSVHGISEELSSHFIEGVRARLVDKDLAPRWDPPTLEHISNDMVDQYFSPLGEFEPELKLPTHMREPFI